MIVPFGKMRAPRCSRIYQTRHQGSGPGVNVYLMAVVTLGLLALATGCVGCTAAEGVVNILPAQKLRVQVPIFVWFMVEVDDANSQIAPSTMLAVATAWHMVVDAGAVN